MIMLLLTEIKSDIIANDTKQDKCFDNSGLDKYFNYEEECSLNIEGEISINNDQKIYTNDKIPDGLVSYYSFDYKRLIDEVGKNHPQHILSEITFTPGVAGIGQALLFDNKLNNNKTKLKIDFITEITQIFTYSFWIFLFPFKENDAEVRILQRGENSIINDKTIYQNLPGFYMNTKTSKLNFLLNTIQDLGESPGSKLETVGGLIVNSWTNIHLIKDLKSIKIILNGMLDSEAKLPNLLNINHQTVNSLFIGNNVLNFMFDELRVYNKVVNFDFIQASVSSFFSSVSYLYQFSLGCSNCSLENANKICSEPRSLCSSLELHLGGYLLGKSVGWIVKGTRVWSKESYDKKDSYQDLVGLGICCCDG